MERRGAKGTCCRRADRLLTMGNRMAAVARTRGYYDTISLVAAAAFIHIACNLEMEKVFFAMTPVLSLLVSASFCWWAA